MSFRRRMMISAMQGENCLTFNVLAEEGQTLSVQPRLGGTITLDFGDGSKQTIPNNSTVTHTYTAGEWVVKIYGATCINCYIRGTANIKSSNEKWAYLGSQFTNGEYMFRDLSNSELAFTSLPEQLTSIKGMFYNDTNALLPLTKLPANVTDIQNAFYTNKKAILPLSILPDGVKLGNGAFRGCHVANIHLTTLPLGLIDGGNMFAECFAADIRISELPTTLTNVTGTFQRCGGIFSISKLPDGLTSCAYMFNDYDQRGSHPMNLDDFVANAPTGGYPSVASIDYMFNWCTELTGSRSAFLALFPNLTSSVGTFSNTNTTE